MAIKLFLQVNGIQGESSNRSYAGWIDALSYSWFASNDMTFDGRFSYGQVTSSPLVVTTRVGKHSPPMMLSVARGGSMSDFGNGTVKLAGLTTVDGTALQFLEIELRDAGVRSFDVAGSGSGNYPAESWAFLYEEATVKYWPINGGSRGTAVTSRWDPRMFPAGDPIYR